MSPLPHRRAAFTLIEMLVVMVVIAILAGIVLSIAGLVQNKAARSRGDAEIKALAGGCDAYKADNGSFPQDAPLTDSLDPRATGTPALSLQTDQRRPRRQRAQRPKRLHAGAQELPFGFLQTEQPERQFEQRRNGRLRQIHQGPVGQQLRLLHQRRRGGAEIPRRCPDCPDRRAAERPRLQPNLRSVVHGGKDGETEPWATRRHHPRLAQELVRSAPESPFRELA